MDGSSKIDSSKAWRLQADTVADMDFETYREQLIHETPAIKSFLEEPRGNVFVISAPKGFGKTLLLLAKAAEVRQRAGSIFTGAGGQLIDKPSGQFPNWTAERVNNLKFDFNFWRNLWRIAIQAACVKHHYRAIGRPLTADDVKCDPTLNSAICNPDIYTTPCEFFVLLIQRPEREQMRIMQNSVDLSARFNTISSQIHIFIDDVDEYFYPLLEDNSAETAMHDEQVFGGKYYRVRSNELWAIAQCSLLGAAMELNETVSHVKIYCTIRHEAFLAIGKYDDRLQKIHGRTLQINYDAKDYRLIFEKNIDLMDAAQLAEPKADDAMTRFVGASSRQIRHRVMRTYQPTFDFILRHTVHRPRDLMLIGRAIANLRPEDRDAEELHRVISEATQTIASSLLAEMRAFFPLPNLDVLARFIPRNALTAQEVETINDSYLASLQVAPQSGSLEHAPLCVLFKIGLLGLIQRKMTDDFPMQSFRKPFEISFDDGACLPHTEEYYLIHPCLDQFILERSGQRYRLDFEARNIVGHGLDWQEPLKSYFVIKGDVCRFSQIMDSDKYPLLIGRLESWAQNIANDVYYYELSGGDSILLIDRNSTRLLDATMQFLNSANNYAEETISLRFGGSAGPLAFHTVNRKRNQTSFDIEIPMGLPLRHAARIEPLASPDTILVDDAFRQLMLERTNGGHDQHGYAFDTVSAEAAGMQADENGKALVRKAPTDPAYPTFLWRVSPRNAGS